MALSIKIKFRLKTKDPIGNSNKDSIAIFSTSVTALNKEYDIGDMKLSQLRSLLGRTSAEYIALEALAAAKDKVNSFPNSVSANVTDVKFVTWAKTFGDSYGFSVFQSW